MNCDEVFAILTRGPFPTGEAWDEQVESHLETCADCWQLAEALRPALEVFQEAVPPAESRDLPGYWGDARPAGAVVAELTETSRRPSVSAQNRRRVPVRTRYETDPFANGLAFEVLRASVLASVFTALVIVLFLYLRG